MIYASSFQVASLPLRSARVFQSGLRLFLAINFVVNQSELVVPWFIIVSNILLSSALLASRQRIRCLGRQELGFESEKDMLFFQTVNISVQKNAAYYSSANVLSADLIDLKTVLFLLKAVFNRSCFSVLLF